MAQANNLIQIKRTSISGRAANTTTLPNPGELALNMTDGILYSGNGSVVFEIGANNTKMYTGVLEHQDLQDLEAIRDLLVLSEQQVSQDLLVMWDLKAI